MFVRSKQRPLGYALPPAQSRALILALYLLYPIGCVLQLIGGAALSLVGIALALIACTAFLLLAGSSLQRQAQEPESELDEREIFERNRATQYAYNILSSLVALALIYLMLAGDLAASNTLYLWTPTIGAHWNAIFWGFFLLSLTLPAAFLAWRKSAVEGER